MRAFIGHLFTLTVLLCSEGGWSQPQDSPRDPHPEVVKLILQAWQAERASRWEEALGLYGRALQTAQERKDRVGEAVTLNNIGGVYSSLGQPQKALEHYHKSLTISGEVKDRRLEAVTLHNIGQVYSDLGQPQKALEHYHKSLPIRQEVGDRVGEAVTLNNIGLVYSDLGQPQKALEHYHKSLPIRQEVGDRVGEAVTLTNIGAVYSDLGQPQKALEHLHKSLTISREVKDRRQEATTLSNIGAVYSDLGQPQKALEHYHKSLTISREVKDRRLEAVTLTNIGGVYSDLGQPQKALEHYHKSLPIRQEVGDRVGEAVTLHNIGVVYSDLGQPQKALEHFQKSLTISREVKDRRQEATTLTNIGAVYHFLGQPQKALEHFQKSLTISREVKHRRQEATTLSNIGQVYSDLGQPQKALEHYHKSLTISREVKDRRQEATTLSNIGAVYSDLGQPQKALEHYHKSLPIRQEVGDRVGEAVTLSNIGQVYSDLGQPQKALEHYHKSLPIRQEVGDRVGEAVTLHNIGQVYHSLGQPQKALEHLHKSLPISREVKHRRQEAVTLTNIGLVYSDLGQPQKALEHYHKSLPISREVKDRRLEATTLSNIGGVYHSLGQPQKALEHLHKSLPISREVKDRSQEATTLSNIGAVYHSLGQTRAAIPLLKRAVNLYQSLRKEIRALDPASRDSYRQRVQPTYTALAELLIQQGRLLEAQQALGLLKEEELFQFLRQRSDFAASETVALTPAERDWNRRYEQISQQVVALGEEYAQLLQLSRSAALTPAQQDRMDRLQRDLEVVQQRFTAFVEEVAREFATADPRGVLREDVKNATLLRESLSVISSRTGRLTVAVWTLAAPERLYLILVTPQLQDVVSVAIKQSDLNAKVSAFRQALTDRRVDPRPSGKALYDLLVKPLEPKLRGVRAMAWSLDGSLRYLPLAALWDGKQYLLERYTTAVLTPAGQSDLTALPRRWSALGFGVSEGGGGFSPLPNVKSEMSAVRSSLQGSEVYLNAGFTRESFFAHLRRGRHRVVHIATHFAFHPGNDTASFLLLGRGQKLPLSAISEEVTTGLFAGVEVLTLSACETAVNGRDFEGFAALAQRAGAGSVIASLWAVSDESTALLMREFYRLRGAQPRRSKSEALRQAQLSLLGGRVAGGSKRPGDRGPKRYDPLPAGATPFRPVPGAPYAHPYYWAPFVLLGNWQ